MHSGWTEEVLDEIFQLVSKGSAETIRKIVLEGPSTSISRIPKSINRFHGLEQLFVYSFKWATLPAGFFVKEMLPALKQLHVGGNGIVTIDPGAFQGSFLHLSCMTHDELLSLSWVDSRVKVIR